MEPRTDGLRLVSASTDHLRPHEKFSYWNETICRTVIDLDCQPIEQPHFEASIGGFDAPGLGVYDIHTRAHRVYRHKAQIARLDSDALIVNYVTAGRLYAEQCGQAVHLAPGDGAVSDAGQPYFLDFDQPLGCVSVKIARSELAHRIPGIERITALSLQRHSSLHPLVFGYLQQLIATAPDLSPAAGLKAAEVLKDLMAASLHEVLQASAGPRPTSRSVTLLRMKAFVEAHFADPALDPLAVARGLRLSVRYLNQLLAAEQTSLGRYIWQRRLTCCAQRLRDPSWRHVPVSVIALELGFNNLSHFSRAFRARFDRSPSEYRAQGQ